MKIANRTCCAGMALLLAILACPAEAARIWLNPNAKLIEGLPLQVELDGVPAGQKVQLSIQQDCDNQGAPKVSADCPLLWGPKEVQETKARYSYSIEAAALGGLPANKFVWVVAQADDWKETSRIYRGDPCSVFKSIFETFSAGDCGLSLAQLLRDATRSAVRDMEELEVWRFELGGEAAEPKVVPGTRGATGVAWAPNGDLLVTLVGEEGSKLIRLPQEGESSALWQAPVLEASAAAPFALADGSYFLVQQGRSPQSLADPQDAAHALIIREIGGTPKSFPLPLKVHQWLKQQGNKLVGLSLGLGDSRPQLFTLDLESGVIDRLGFANELYLALQREPVPGSKRALASWYNRAGGFWQISMVEEGVPLADLVKNGEDNLGPVWRPSGGEFAYLAKAP